MFYKIESPGSGLAHFKYFCHITRLFLTRTKRVITYSGAIYISQWFVAQLNDDPNRVSEGEVSCESEQMQEVSRWSQRTISRTHRGFQPFSDQPSCRLYEISRSHILFQSFQS